MAEEIQEGQAYDGPMIVARDVHKWFGSFHVLRGVTTSVDRGQKVVIVGPSGSGKSTFIRTINRLEEHQRGDIIVDGVPMTQDVRNIDAIRRDVGMVFQQFNLFPHLSVMQNIALAPIKVRKWKRGRGGRSGDGAAGAGGHTGAGGQVPPASYPAVSSSASPSPGRWPCGPTSCSSTSRHRRWTRK